MSYVQLLDVVIGSNTKCYTLMRTHLSNSA